MMAEILSAVGEAASGMATAAAPVAPVVEAGTKLGSAVPSFAELAASQSDKFIPSLNTEIFTNTVKLSSFPVFEDRPVASLNVLKDTVPVVEAPKEVTVFESSAIFQAEPKTIDTRQLIEEQIVEGHPEPVPELQDSRKVELTVREEHKVEELTDKVIDQSTQEPRELPKVESTGANKPQLEVLNLGREVEMAQKVKALLVETGIEEKAADRIAGQSLREAVTRREWVEETGIKEERKAVGSGSAGVEFVRDEEADEARRQDAQNAIDRVFPEDQDAVQKSGSEIAGHMNQNPKEDEISEIVPQTLQRSDGSYEEILKDLSEDHFDSKEDARTAIEKLILEKPAVKVGKGKRVGEEDIKRVLKLDKNKYQM